MANKIVGFIARLGGSPVDRLGFSCRRAFGSDRVFSEMSLPRAMMVERPVAQSGDTKAQRRNCSYRARAAPAWDDSAL